MARGAAAAIVALALVSMASARMCPAFMHEVTAKESIAQYPLGIDVLKNYPQQICASLPQWSGCFFVFVLFFFSSSGPSSRHAQLCAHYAYLKPTTVPFLTSDTPAPAVFDLKRFKATAVPHCTTSNTAGVHASSYLMNFTPETPCESCDRKYCTKPTSAGTCTCTLPSGYNVTQDVTVYTKSEICTPHAEVKRWETGAVTMSPKNLPYADLKCPTSALHQPRDAAQRATLAQVAEQYFKHAFPEFNKTSSFCEHGAVQSFEISNVSGCLKYAGKEYKGYGPKATYAQVRAVVKYSCPHAGRSYTMGEFRVDAPLLRGGSCTRPTLNTLLRVAPRHPIPTLTPYSLHHAGITKASGGYTKVCSPVVFKS
jgi:hypothetical protein